MTTVAEQRHAQDAQERKEAGRERNEKVRALRKQRAAEVARREVFIKGRVLRLAAAQEKKQAACEAWKVTAFDTYRKASEDLQAVEAEHAADEAESRRLLKRIDDELQALGVQ